MTTRMEIHGYVDLEHDEGAEELDADALADFLEEVLLERGADLLEHIEGWTAVAWHLSAVAPERVCAACQHLEHWHWARRPPYGAVPCRIRRCACTAFVASEATPVEGHRGALYRPS